MPVTASLSRASIVALLGNDPIDNNFGVGCVILARCSTVSASGSTVAGSSLYKVVINDAGSNPTISTTLSGTWRNIGGSTDGITETITTFQRIL